MPSREFLDTHRVKIEKEGAGVKDWVKKVG